MCLYDLKIGEFGTINNITGDSKLTKRLSALGLTKGTTIQYTGIAPLGDPIIVNLRGFNLALRKKDAENITLQK